jgi:hypothetical protein
MLISAEFQDRRSRAFLQFLEEARRIPGYYQKTDAAGHVSHAIEFTERTYLKILDGFGDRLERTWGGVFSVNGRQTRLTHLWQRHLRAADIMDNACCEACGTALGRLPLKVEFVVKNGVVDYRVNCLCGADITGIYTTAHAISTAKTPVELVKKSRGEA